MTVEESEADYLVSKLRLVHWVREQCTTSDTDEAQLLERQLALIEFGCSTSRTYSSGQYTSAESKRSFSARTGPLNDSIRSSVHRFCRYTDARTDALPGLLSALYELESFGTTPRTVTMAKRAAPRAHRIVQALDAALALCAHLANDTIDTAIPLATIILNRPVQLSDFVPRSNPVPSVARHSPLPSPGTELPQPRSPLWPMSASAPSRDLASALPLSSTSVTLAHRGLVGSGVVGATLGGPPAACSTAAPAPPLTAHIAPPLTATTAATATAATAAAAAAAAFASAMYRAPQSDDSPAPAVAAGSAHGGGGRMANLTALWPPLAPPTATTQSAPSDLRAVQEPFPSPADGAALQLPTPHLAGVAVALPSPDALPALLIARACNAVIALVQAKAAKAAAAAADARGEDVRRFGAGYDKRAAGMVWLGKTEAATAAASTARSHAQVITGEGDRGAFGLDSETATAGGASGQRGGTPPTCACALAGGNMWDVLASVTACTVHPRPAISRQTEYNRPSRESESSTRGVRDSHNASVSGETPNDDGRIADITPPDSVAWPLEPTAPPSEPPSPTGTGTSHTLPASVFGSEAGARPRGAHPPRSPLVSGRKSTVLFAGRVGDGSGDAVSDTDPDTPSRRPNRPSLPRQWSAAEQWEGFAGRNSESADGEADRRTDTGATEAAAPSAPRECQPPPPPSHVYVYPGCASDLDSLPVSVHTFYSAGSIGASVVALAACIVRLQRQRRRWAAAAAFHQFQSWFTNSPVLSVGRELRVRLGRLAEPLAALVDGNGLDTSPDMDLGTSLFAARHLGGVSRDKAGRLIGVEVAGGATNTTGGGGVGPLRGGYWTRRAPLLSASTAAAAAATSRPQATEGTDDARTSPLAHPAVAPLVRVRVPNPRHPEVLEELANAERLDGFRHGVRPAGSALTRRPHRRPGASPVVSSLAASAAAVAANTAYRCAIGDDGIDPLSSVAPALGGGKAPAESARSPPDLLAPLSPRSRRVAERLLGGDFVDDLEVAVAGAPTAEADGCTQLLSHAAGAATALAGPAPADGAALSDGLADAAGDVLRHALRYLRAAEIFYLDVALGVNPAALTALPSPPSGGAARMLADGVGVDAGAWERRDSGSVARSLHTARGGVAARRSSCLAPSLIGGATNVGTATVVTYSADSAVSVSGGSGEAGSHRRPGSVAHSARSRGGRPDAGMTCERLVQTMATDGVTISGDIVVGGDGWTGGGAAAAVAGAVSIGGPHAAYFGMVNDALLRDRTGRLMLPPPGRPGDAIVAIPIPDQTVDTVGAIGTNAVGSVGSFHVAALTAGSGDAGDGAARTTEGRAVGRLRLAAAGDARQGVFSVGCGFRAWSYFRRAGVEMPTRVPQLPPSSDAAAGPSVLPGAVSFAASASATAASSRASHSGGVVAAARAVGIGRRGSDAAVPVGPQAPVAHAAPAAAGGPPRGVGRRDAGAVLAALAAEGAIAPLVAAVLGESLAPRPCGGGGDTASGGGGPSGLPSGGLTGAHAIGDGLHPSGHGDAVCAAAARPKPAVSRARGSANYYPPIPPPKPIPQHEAEFQAALAEASSVIPPPPVQDVLFEVTHVAAASRFVSAVSADASIAAGGKRGYSSSVALGAAPQVTVGTAGAVTATGQGGLVVSGLDAVAAEVSAANAFSATVASAGVPTTGMGILGSASGGFAHARTVSSVSATLTSRARARGSFTGGRGVSDGLAGMAGSLVGDAASGDAAIAASSPYAAFLVDAPKPQTPRIIARRHSSPGPTVSSAQTPISPQPTRIPPKPLSETPRASLAHAPVFPSTAPLDPATARMDPDVYISSLTMRKALAIGLLDAAKPPSYAADPWLVDQLLSMQPPAVRRAPKRQRSRLSGPPRVGSGARASSSRRLSVGGHAGSDYGDSARSSGSDNGPDDASRPPHLGTGDPAVPPSDVSAPPPVSQGTAASGNVQSASRFTEALSAYLASGGLCVGCDARQARHIGLPQYGTDAICLCSLCYEGVCAPDAPADQPAPAAAAPVDKDRAATQGGTSPPVVSLRHRIPGSSPDSRPSSSNGRAGRPAAAPTSDTAAVGEYVIDGVYVSGSAAVAAILHKQSIHTRGALPQYTLRPPSPLAVERVRRMAMARMRDWYHLHNVLRMCGQYAARGGGAVTIHVEPREGVAYVTEAGEAVGLPPDTSAAGTTDGRTGETSGRIASDVLSPLSGRVRPPSGNYRSSLSPFDALDAVL